MAAALQYAFVTSTAEYFLSAIALASGITDVFTISSSFLSSSPERCSRSRRSFGSGNSDSGRAYSFGIVASRAAIASFARAFPSGIVI